jgi:hypothetical protein
MLIASVEAAKYLASLVMRHSATKMFWVQKRRENHYLDCELMIDVAAIITRLLKVTQKGEKVGG